MITAKDVECIYEVPLVFHEEGLDERIVEKLNIWTGAPHLDEVAEASSQTFKHPKETRQDRDGRQVRRPDRLLQEPERGAGPRRRRPTSAASRSSHVDSEKIEQDGLADDIQSADGILVPRGFGPRGTEGKIAAVQLRPREARSVLRHLLRHADGRRSSSPATSAVSTGANSIGGQSRDARTRSSIS